MDGSSFFMTLPSNVPVMYGSSENTTSAYVTHLAKPISLDHSWEVALVEFLYPVSWYNLDDKEITQIKLTRRARVASDVDLNVGTRRSKYLEKVRLKKRKGIIFDSLVKDGYVYETNTFSLGHTRISDKDKFMEYVDRILRFRGFKGKLVFKADNRHEAFIVIEEDQELEFHPMLARMLGYDQHIFNTYSEKKRFGGKYEIDPNGGFEFIYIYCDIVQPSFVGNIMSPLLRTVIANREWGQRVSHVFEQPHYVPLAIEDIQKVSIKILSDTGNPVQFESGKVLVKLHFKQKDGGV